MLASAACQGAGPVGRSPVATVAGTGITFDRVDGLLAAQARFYAERRDSAPAGTDTSQTDQLLAAIPGKGRATLGAAAFTDAMQQLITYQVVTNELARQGTTVTQADLDATRATLVQQVGSKEELGKLDKEFVDETVRSQAAQDALGKTIAPSEADLRAQYERDKPNQPLCVAVISTADEAGATAALARVKAGEDFGAVAAEVSTNPASAQQGGFAGCGSPDAAAGAFGGDFTDVAVGDLLGPTKASGAFVVAQVVSLTGPTFEQDRARLEQQATQGAQDGTAVSARIQELLLAANVTVDAKYGRWDAGTGTVSPPPDPAAITLTPAAGTAPAVPAQAPSAGG